MLFRGVEKFDKLVLKTKSPNVKVDVQNMLFCQVVSQNALFCSWSHTSQSQLKLSWRYLNLESSVYFASWGRSTPGDILPFP